MPFFEAHIKNAHISHLLSGMCERSYSVPVMTVNCLRHSLSLHW